MVLGEPRLAVRRHRKVVVVLAVSIALALSGLGIESASASTRSRLAVSLNSDRSSAARLDGSRVNGKIYVFVRNSKKIDKVDFYIDSPQWRKKPPVRTDKKAPFDLAGTASDGTARPYNTAKLADGTHTIRAVMTRTDGTTLYPAGALQGPQRGRETGTHPYADGDHHCVAIERADIERTDDGTHHNSTGHDGPNQDRCASAANDDLCASNPAGSHGYGYTA